jgi:hypothetical protein
MDEVINFSQPCWKKPEPDRLFYDGERLLLAVMVNNNVTNTTNYEFYIVRVMCDSETPVEFVHDLTDEAFTEWEWEDIDWYIEMKG